MVVSQNGHDEVRRFWRRQKNSWSHDVFMYLLPYYVQCILETFTNISDEQFSGQCYKYYGQIHVYGSAVICSCAYK
jgi:hypothetical protein